jgi:hypothetical protein
MAHRGFQAKAAKITNKKLQIPDNFKIIMTKKGKLRLPSLVKPGAGLA